MRFKGFIGPAYTLDSVNVECQRCVNLYPEITETGTGKEGEIARLKWTPGLTKLITVGNGPIRLIHRDPQDRVFVASGNQMYSIAYSGTIWSKTLLGALNTSNGTMKAASTLLPNGDCVTVFVDGTDSYAFKYISGSGTFDSYANLSYVQVDDASHVSFIDGYFLFNKLNTGQYYTSTWGDFSVDPLSFATAEGDPDNLVAMIDNHRYLWLFNEKTTEVVIDTGNPDFPFERVPSGFIEKGCAAPFSVAKVDGVVFWLGRDRTGQGIVYAAQGLQPQRISTHAIEIAIQGYDPDSITAADGYTYSMNGHSFYVINFPETTWVYDLTTKLWHERAYNNAGLLERHRANYHEFIPQYNIHLVGDYADNRIYQFDDTVFADDTSAIKRIRSSPHISNSMKRLFCNSLQLDIESGVGLSGGVQGADPQAMLDWSDDGGHTWSSEMWASIGAIGAYKARAKWNRLGSFRDRVFRITISDPVKVSLLGAELDIVAGAS